MKKGKQEVISFKADQELAEALGQMPNRSEFIRQAVQAALSGVCPLCQGTGTLSPEQVRHWQGFARSHAVAECGQCHALHLVCRHAPAPGGRVHRETGR